jgi:hypothetical protein
MKKIKFYANSQDVYDLEDAPKPATNFIPSWYKKMNLRSKEVLDLGRPQSTAKSCQPLLDSFTSGYMVCAPQDIVFFDETADTKSAQWRATREYPVIEKEDLDRMDGFFVPDEYVSYAFRISTYPTIQTPAGTSVLITHPFNRYDLPFLALSGIVDTDKLHMPLTVSILIKKNFNGVIEKGTPLVQVVPFIRENWEHEICLPLDKKQININNFKLFSTMYNSYKKNFWTKKIYK